MLLCMGLLGVCMGRTPISQPHLYHFTDGPTGIPKISIYVTICYHTAVLQ